MVKNPATVRNVGIVMFDGVEELDAIGPWEVLSTWARYFADDGYRVFCLSRKGGEVQCAKGLTVRTQHSFADAPPMEVMLYPGGRGTRPQLHDEAQLEWVRRQRDAVPLMTSVCTGSLVFAAAGLLAHRPATTHWAALEQLAAIDPTVDIRRDERFVDDGDIITAAGVSAGIDMALHLIVRLAGAARAREVRRFIQYDPAPPV